MKKILLPLVTLLIISSCGKEHKNETEEQIEAQETIENEYVVLLDAIYEKNDTVKLFVYDENNNEYLDKVIKTPVTGSNLSQVIELKLPINSELYNLGLGFSSNNEQDNFTLKSITIRNKGEIIVRPDNYLTFFANNDALTMNMETSKHSLKHDKPYPPGLIGNDNMKSFLSN